MSAGYEFFQSLNVLKSFIWPLFLTYFVLLGKEINVKKFFGFLFFSFLRGEGCCCIFLYLQDVGFL